MTYFLDANICIHFLNKTSPGVIDKLLETRTRDVKIPSVVAAELIYGAMKSARKDYNLARLETFLSVYETLPFTRDTARIYGQVRADLEHRGKLIGGNDMLIAATALAGSGTLVTDNIKEFSRIKALPLENWTHA
jgi:Predicted nucleic acid-binding protein, contains PIN domain